MRGQLGPAWELVSRWEKLQPVRHRTPVPEVVVKSLVVLAWCKGYRRWAACTLVGYFGLARIGEVLRATRAHLLLPADHCSLLQVAFLRLESPKSSGRGGPKVQHLKVDEALVVELLAKAFSSLDVSEKLYPFGPAAYRSRWNFLLEHFGLKNQQELTPGGGSLGVPPRLCCGGHTMAYASSPPAHPELLSARSGGDQLRFGCRGGTRVTLCSARLSFFRFCSLLLEGNLATVLRLQACSGDAPQASLTAGTGA